MLKLLLSSTPPCLLQLVASAPPIGSCPSRGFLSAASSCAVNTTNIAANGLWVLEPATRVAGQPRIHGQFYVRSFVSSALQHVSCGGEGVPAEPGRSSATPSTSPHFCFAHQGCAKNCLAINQACPLPAHPDTL
jgi:hypothetical protein